METHHAPSPEKHIPFRSPRSKEMKTHSAIHSLSNRAMEVEVCRIASALTPSGSHLRQRFKRCCFQDALEAVAYSFRTRRPVDSSRS